MCSIGDCFIVLPPYCEPNAVIFGRNSIDRTANESQEVHYLDANTSAKGKCDGGVEADVDESFCIVLQKPRPGVWGSDCGANERNVCMGIQWSADEAETGSGQLKATDIVRYVLATATTAKDALEQLNKLLQAHGTDNAKFSFVICDATEAWTVSCGGKLWAAQLLMKGYHRLINNGLQVTTTIDKSSEDLDDALKTLGLWNGDGELNFAKCFGVESETEKTWCGTTPLETGSYSLTSMFETLRSAGEISNAGSANVSVLKTEGDISSHWFTITPNPNESVFKPFVFAPNPKISPLTKVLENATITLLDKLHAQRKPAAIENLKTLEASCVEEVNKYLSEHPTLDEELDELMKDCVEAEVKFYR